MPGVAKFAVNQFLFFLWLCKVSGSTGVTLVEGVEVGEKVNHRVLVHQAFWVATSVLEMRNWADEGGRIQVEAGSGLALRTFMVALADVAVDFVRLFSFIIR